MELTNLQILKRLYKDYTEKFLKKIFLAVFFSILVAASTSATAWLLDPAIEKIFLNKDQTLIYIIPILIIIAFSTKGISLYLAKILADKDVTLSKLARGVPVGGDLEYVDDATLIRAMEGRISV